MPPPSDKGRLTYREALRVTVRQAAATGEVGVLAVVCCGMAEMAIPYPAARWPLQVTMMWLLLICIRHITKADRKKVARDE